MGIYSALVNEIVGKIMKMKVQIVSYQLETSHQFLEEYKLKEVTNRKIHYCTDRGIFIITEYRLNHRSGSSYRI